MKKLILFDIDGTLLSTSRAGFNAFLEAYREIFSLSKESETPAVNFSGGTDGAIYKSLAELSGGKFEDTWEDFKSRYIGKLKARSKNPVGWKLHDGVLSLLQSLQNKAVVGLLTGNLKECAKIKTETLGISEYFPFGAFADDGILRSDIAKVAFERGKEYSKIDFRGEDVWVVGDTPKDIDCALEIGANTLAVSTGGYSYLELKEHKPTILVESLSEISSDTLLS